MYDGVHDMHANANAVFTVPAKANVCKMMVYKVCLQRQIQFIRDAIHTRCKCFTELYKNA